MAMLRHLTNGSSRDSGFTSQDTLYTQPISEHQVKLFTTSGLLELFTVYFIEACLLQYIMYILFLLLLKFKFILIGIKCLFSI